METLLEDYKRRLKTANELLKETDRIAYPIKYVRIETKASCYRTIIAELERAQAEPSSVPQANELLPHVSKAKRTVCDWTNDGYRPPCYMNKKLKCENCEHAKQTDC